MSKRSREESDSSEYAHQRQKRLKNDNGDAQRVSPRRFDQTYRSGNRGASLQDDPFSCPQSDEDNDNKMNFNHNSNHNSNSNSSSNQSDSEDFGTLLYELASLNVGQESPDDLQTCPICSTRVPLRSFPDHVHQCLDQMDEGDRNDLRSQTEKDEDFATQYALKNGWVTDYATECPSCGKRLVLGSGINEHVNQCMDEMLRRAEDQANSMDDEDEDSDIEGNPMGNTNGNSNGNSMGNTNGTSIGNAEGKKVEPMSRAQMIECASKLMTLQSGTDEFKSMLGMFGALGFNRQNVQSVLQIEKQQDPLRSPKRPGNTNMASPSKERVDQLVTIPEDEDLSRLGLHNGSMRNVEDIVIDDDDL